MTTSATVALALAGMFALAGVAPLAARRLGRDAGYVLAAGFVAAAAAIAVHLPSVVNDVAVDVSAPWFASAGIHLTLHLDGLSMVFSLLILGVGALVMAYSARYFSTGQRQERLLGFLTLFAASMLGLVLAGDVIVLFVFWELTSITSFFLIGGDGVAGRKPATRALLVTALGGLALLAGLILAGVIAGTFDLREMIADPDLIRGHGLAGVVMALVLAGAFTKSAQFPFHFWLPGAMVAPTPVSTYLHAATMVKAGIYLVARMSPVFGGMQSWTYVLVLVGLVTALIGAVMALKQFDLKALLAYSTVSQLGFLMALVGLGTFTAAKAAMVHIIAHGTYKATLFMVVGIIDHEAGSRDIRSLGGLRRSMPVTAVITAVAALSMAGIPPLLGFVSKEEAFAALLAAPGAAWFAPLAVTMALASAAVTFAYGARIFYNVFLGPARQDLYEPAKLFLAPPAVTAATGLVLGLVVWTLDGIVGRAARDVLGVAGEAHLALWHGMEPALGLSVLTIVAGLGLFAARHPLDRLLHAPASRPGGPGVFDAAYDGIIQAGKLAGRPFLSLSPARHFLWVIVTLGCTGLGVWIVRADAPMVPAPPSLPQDWVVAIVLAPALVAAAVTMTRLAAVALVGVSGFLIAVLYVILGAPDLALTQLLVETLTVALVVLVFKGLPDGFALVPRIRSFGAAAVAGAAGLLAALGTFELTGRRGLSELAAYFMRAAPEDAAGHNVVNTILVDFRALDTLGEITVLAVAAIGVFAMVRLVPPPERRVIEVERDTETLIFRATTRVLTPAVIVLSLFLLLRGHNDPGGGFIAALAAGALLMLHYLAGGSEQVRRILPLGFAALIGIGLTVAVATGLASLVVGAEFLTSAIAYVPLPWGGEYKLVTSLLFDIGVYLVVLAVVVAIVSYLGEEHA